MVQMVAGKGLQIASGGMVDSSITSGLMAGASELIDGSPEEQAAKEEQAKKDEAAKKAEESN